MLISRLVEVGGENELSAHDKSYAYCSFNLEITRRIGQLDMLMVCYEICVIGESRCSYSIVRRPLVCSSIFYSTLCRNHGFLLPVRPSVMPQISCFLAAPFALSKRSFEFDKGAYLSTR